MLPERAGGRPEAPTSGCAWVCAQQRYTRRKQTLSAQPKACFATTASGSCLCVLEGSSVTMHLANGDTHVVALPCKAVGLWALPAGVLVEPPRADGGPVAHLLNEPLEELRTVVMTRASASAEPPGDILLSSARAPLVLTHQPRARAHALWRVAGGGTPGGAAELAAWWEQPAGSAASAAESSFFAPEDGGAGVGELPLLLCVAQPERELLHVYSLGAPAAAPPPTRRPLVVDEAAAAPGATPRVSTVGALPAVAAQPVRGCGAGSGAGGGGGSGGVARILALGADGSLALWQCGSSGVHCLLRCSNDVLAPHAGWPTVSPAMAMAAATPGAGAARSTLYGCAPRVDSLVLKTAQGAEMRAQLLRPADDPLVRQCLSALRRALPAAAYEQLSLGLVCHSLAMAPADYVGAPDAPPYRGATFPRRYSRFSALPIPPPPLPVPSLGCPQRTAARMARHRRRGRRCFAHLYTFAAQDARRCSAYCPRAPPQMRRRRQWAPRPWRRPSVTAPLSRCTRCTRHLSCRR